MVEIDPMGWIIFCLGITGSPKSLGVRGNRNTVYHNSGLTQQEGVSSRGVRGEIRVRSAIADSQRFPSQSPGMRWCFCIRLA